MPKENSDMAGESYEDVGDILVNEDTDLQDLWEEAQSLTITNTGEEGQTASESYEDASVNLVNKGTKLQDL